VNLFVIASQHCDLSTIGGIARCSAMQCTVGF
jgi:hypothetical protein